MTDTYTEPNTEYLVKIDKNAVDTIRREYRGAVPGIPSETIYHIRPVVAKTYNEILDRLIKNDFKPLELDMSTGERIRLETYVEPGQTPCLANCEWFDVKCSADPFLCSNSLTEIAAKLVDYRHITKRAYGGMVRLHKLASMFHGYTLAELEIGIDICIKIIEQKGDPATETDFTKYKGLPNMNPERIKELIRLSNNWDTYSDKYKSVYGHRPKFTETA